MQKPSTITFTRSVLGMRPPEKENNSISSNTALDQKTYNLIKYKKQSSQITTCTENPSNDTSLHDITMQKNNKANNKSFIQSSENMKLNPTNKSQELSKDLKKNITIDKFKRINEKIEKKIPKAIGNILTKEKITNNFSFINNIPSSKPSITTNIYYDNITKKNKNDQNIPHKEEKNSISNLFPAILENFHLSNTLTNNETLSVSYPVVENSKLAKFYAKDIMETLINKDSFLPKNFLEFHKIPYHLRSRMIDWMVEVLYSYKCQDQTFFLAVSVMDGFFKHSKICYDISEMHLVGVTSMFIASKYEEIYPFKLKLVYEKIGHKKISIEEIKKKEQEILEVLNFNLLTPTPNEFTMLAIQILNTRTEIQRKTKIYLEKVCVYLLKMVLHDYDLISKINYHVLAASTIFVAFKIIENIDPDFKSEIMAKEIKKIFNLNDGILFDTATKILYLAKNFEKLYPNLDNLKKFNGFTILQNDKKA